MEEIIDFLATKEVLIVLAIIGIIMFVYFILWFYEFMKKHEEKKKLQNNTMELNKLVEEVAKARKEEQVEKTNNVDNTNIIATEPKEEEVKQEVVEAIITPIVNEPIIEEVKNVEEVQPVVKEEAPSIVIENKVSSPIEVEPVVVSVNEPPITTNDSIMLNDMFEEKVEVVSPTIITPVDSPKNEEEVIKYKDEVYTESEAKRELERITEELKKLENEDKEENIELTKFETEQEENAIISLDELIAKGKTITEQNEITQYQDDGNEPISIQELEERYKKEKEEIEVLEEEPKEKRTTLSIDEFLGSNQSTVSVSEAYSSNKSTYHPSPIISPIYGIEKEPVKKNTTLELENTANYEKFDEEIRKTNEFLSKLKELQQKLD